MKSIFFTVVFFVSFVGNAAAQQTQAIKVGPLGFLFGNYNLRYEKGIGEKSSVQVGANYFDYEVLDVGATGFGVDLSYRYYFKQAIEGAYVSPALNFDFATTTNLADENVSFSTVGLGVTAGYQWVAGGGFVVDLGLGYGYNFELAKDDSLTDDYNYGGVRFTFALGYAF